METKDREPDNQRFKEPVYGIRRTDQTKEGAVFKKAEEDYINIFFEIWVRQMVHGLMGKR